MASDTHHILKFTQSCEIVTVGCGLVHTAFHETIQQQLSLDLAHENIIFIEAPYIERDHYYNLIMAFNMTTSYK